MARNFGVKTSPALVTLGPPVVTMQCANCGGVSFAAAVGPNAAGTSAKIVGLQCTACGKKFEIDEQARIQGDGRFNLERQD